MTADKGRRGKRVFPPSGFSNMLRVWRTKRELTQAALAEAVGCHEMTIAKLEGGKQEPNWPLVLVLCKALDCTPNDFMLPEPPKRKPGRPRKGDGGG